MFRFLREFPILLRRLVAAIEQIQMNGIISKPADMDARLWQARYEGFTEGSTIGYRNGYKAARDELLGPFEPALLDNGRRSGQVGP